MASPVGMTHRPENELTYLHMVCLNDGPALGTVVRSPAGGSRCPTQSLSPVCGNLSPRGASHDLWGGASLARPEIQHCETPHRPFCEPARGQAAGQKGVNQNGGCDLEASWEHDGGGIEAS